MSDKNAGTDPIRQADPIGSALDGFAVPAMSAGFVDRVVSATAGRATALPATRGSSTRWRSVRRVLIGAAAAGALGTAAAATGLLEELGVDLPSPEEVWTTITGEPDDRSTATSERTPATPISEPRPSEIEGPVDTPEELEEVFRRVDEVRSERRDTRRERVDQRIDDTIERRRAEGLPMPSPEQEARLKGRIEQVRERRDERVEQSIEQRREELRDRIANGEALPLEQFEGRPADLESATPVGDRLRRLREMSPQDRRETIRRLREERQQRLGANGGGAQTDTAAREKKTTPPQLPE